MSLDKFYTKKDIAERCYDFYIENFPEAEEKTFLEPSAGDGVFLNFLKKYVAIDIKPENNNIKQQDFFTFDSEENYYTIGNPPFGKRSQMAIDFFNHAAKFSNIIGFIVPVSFMKWSVQKQLSNNFWLKDYFYLPSNSFLANGKDYDIRTVFQIWVSKNYCEGEDKRLKKSPPISHKDFNIWQYNATPQSLSVIEENWVIATYRQGRYNYNNLFTRDDYNYIKEKMTGQKKQQFFFIEPLTEESNQIIRRMDFNALAARNTLTPGFGKGDFVSYYEELKNSYK